MFHPRTRYAALRTTMMVVMAPMEIWSRDTFNPSRARVRIWSWNQISHLLVIRPLKLQLFSKEDMDTSSLLDLPQEIKNQIYDYVFIFGAVHIHRWFGETNKYRCGQLYHHSCNCFGRCTSRCPRSFCCRKLF